MRRLLALLLLWCTFPIAPCQGQVVSTGRGEVEFVGLEDWTATELADTLRAISPDQSLHACAADLRKELGFADASAIGYLDDGDVYTVVTVVEPQYADRIQYVNVSPDTLPDAANYEKALALYEEDRRSFNGALQSYGDVLVSNRDSVRNELPDWVDAEITSDLWDFLEDRRSEADREQAYWRLTTDGNYRNRMVSAAILANFTESDLTWWRLADALRDPDARVSGTAQAVINTILDSKPRKVNWTPALHSLQHLMRGTNLFAYNTVLEMLPQTGLNRALASQLLTGGANDLLAAYLDAEFGKVREYGQEFLSAVADVDDSSSPDWQKVLRRVSKDG